MSLKIHICLCLIISYIATSCNQNKTPQPYEKTLPIAIAQAIEKDVPIYIEAIGNVYSLQTVQIRPQVGGIIQKAFVKQGQYVKKGDPLYQIDPRPYQANLEAAKAALIKDSATLKFDMSRVNRYSELVKQEYFSKINYEQFTTNVEADEGQILNDKANIAIAALNLEWTTPVSPIDGKISQFNIDPGNLVVANDTAALTDIRQITPADIRFKINQKDFVAVQKAIQSKQLKFEVILPEEPLKSRKGEVYFIDNHIDLSTGTILIKGTVPNEDEFLWPGEFIHVRLQLEVIKNAVLIPEEAINVGQQGTFVYVYDPQHSTVSLRVVNKGERFGKFYVIREGVLKDEQVVTRGQVNLRPGSKVYVEKKQAQADINYQ